ncbi:MAG: helix-turn-helix domain-containing protein [Prolixibacteraceae bacterium]|nr:helix-turn-helix domain-containing protein [Prolixibacteraceae bacterium]MBT6005465.1 helix-turn-helix domain-containing protein [Prolixibacteraceae bacterium]MBT6763305.1 helix-turn-helix domain-containing protein [Prolixibacteraceae bacterium]MBT6997842.1 helix-turn-helix domain-containing protein [Prolixibacteraceae bacterium]MBT7394206.1 helix-turn-helix domain-containing protein [Prolixibacteraceae bacterium]
MKGIIIPLTEEEFQAHLTAAVLIALENFIPKNKGIEYLTRKEVATKLHISLPTLNEYTKSGKLKAYRINGRVLYRNDEIESALTSVEPLKYRRS